MAGLLLAVDFEDLKGQMKEDDMNKLESVVVAKMKDLESLCDAFRGCHAVFHTSSFVDPHGISGYSVSYCSIIVQETSFNVNHAWNLKFLGVICELFRHKKC